MLYTYILYCVVCVTERCLIALIVASSIVTAAALAVAGVCAYYVATLAPASEVMSTTDSLLTITDSLLSTLTGSFLSTTTASSSFLTTASSSSSLLTMASRPTSLLTTESLSTTASPPRECKCLQYHLK
jgi:predicted PurR-regulated permease PerM